MYINICLYNINIYIYIIHIQLNISNVCVCVRCVCVHRTVNILNSHKFYTYPSFDICLFQS